MRQCGSSVPGSSTNQSSNCSDSTYFATQAGTVKYNAYIDSVKNDFEESYKAEVLKAQNMEKFAVTYSSSEYHYTLYYYDQAGNLVKTVPLTAGVLKDRSGGMDQPGESSQSSQSPIGTCPQDDDGVPLQYPEPGSGAENTGCR